jgi:toxin ParE1/3/4
MRRILKSRRAIQDLIEIYEFIVADKIAPAERFLDVAEASFDRIAQMPGIGREWISRQPQFAGMRVYPLPHRYRNYLVFYRLVGEDVEIFRVLHGARDISAVLQQMIEESEN